MERNTKQRAAILDALRTADRPLGPVEISALAGRSLPRLGVATVYRTIKVLLEEKLLVKVDLPGEAARYELSGKKHHHHFVCTLCDRVFDIEGCPGSLNNLAPAGFTVQSHDVLLYGSCPACSKKSCPTKFVS